MGMLSKEAIENKRKDLISQLGDKMAKGDDTSGIHKQLEDLDEYIIKKEKIYAGVRATKRKNRSLQRPTKHYCDDCGGSKFYRYSKRCMKCHRKEQRRIKEMKTT